MAASRGRGRGTLPGVLGVFIIESDGFVPSSGEGVRTSQVVAQVVTRPASPGLRTSQAVVQVVSAVVITDAVRVTQLALEVLTDIGDAEEPETPPQEGPTPPAAQRAGYVFFSNQITEQQVETRMSRNYFSILYTDSQSTAPSALTFVQIIGTLRSPAGAAISSGRLYIKPRTFIVANGHLLSANTTSVDVTDPLNFMLAPSNGVPYDVQYDPDPSRPIARNLKPGYFDAVWIVPNVGPVDVGSL